MPLLCGCWPVWPPLHTQTPTQALKQQLPHRGNGFNRSYVCSMHLLTCSSSGQTFSQTPVIYSSLSVRSSPDRSEPPSRIRLKLLRLLLHKIIQKLNSALNSRRNYLHKSDPESSVNVPRWFFSLIDSVVQRFSAWMYWLYLCTPITAERFLLQGETWDWGQIMFITEETDSD